jgi:hypothetical protein
MMSKWSNEDVVKFLDVYEELEGLWNIRHFDYNNKMKRDSAMLKLMGELLNRNVAVESVEVLRKKIKYKTRVPARLKHPKKVERELKMFISLNLSGLGGPICF